MDKIAYSRYMTALVPSSCEYANCFLKEKQVEGKDWNNS